MTAGFDAGVPSAPRPLGWRLRTRDGRNVPFLKTMRRESSVVGSFRPTRRGAFSSGAGSPETWVRSPASRLSVRSRSEAHRPNGRGLDLSRWLALPVLPVEAALAAVSCAKSTQAAGRSNGHRPWTLACVGGPCPPYKTPTRCFPHCVDLFMAGGPLGSFGRFAPGADARWVRSRDRGPQREPVGFVRAVRTGAGSVCVGFVRANRAGTSGSLGSFGDCRPREPT